MTLTDDDRETLRSNLHAPSTTPDADRARCPECGSPTVEIKTSAPGDREYPPDYRCTHGHHFDEPVRGGDADGE